jgi:hypothetical protein
MIMDHYTDKWIPLTRPYAFDYPPIVPPPSAPITDEEIQEFRRLLERAREYDRRNNEPDCEMEEKKQKLLKLAEELGINIDFI